MCIGHNQLDDVRTVDTHLVPEHQQSLWTHITPSDKDVFNPAGTNGTCLCCVTIYISITRNWHANIWYHWADCSRQIVYIFLTQIRWKIFHSWVYKTHDVVAAHIWEILLRLDEWIYTSIHKVYTHTHAVSKESSMSGFTIYTWIQLIQPIRTMVLYEASTTPQNKSWRQNSGPVNSWSTSKLSFELSQVSALIFWQNAWQYP